MSHCEPSQCVKYPLLNLCGPLKPFPRMSLLKVEYSLHIEQFTKWVLARLRLVETDLMEL